MTRTQRGAIVCAVFILARVDNPVGDALPYAGSQTSACAAAEYRQFDFWVGDWDVFDTDKPAPVAPVAPASAVAHVRVEPILDGCVLREDYEGANGLHGQSFSLYDASRRVWHQSWVTSRGQLLLIEGGRLDQEMIMAGVDPAKGPAGRVRGVWTPVHDGVREVAMTSTDGGKTWTPWFDLSFRSHKAR